MKNILVFTLILLISAAASIPCRAQSLVNTNWKSYIAQLGDTITLHFKQDSSFVTNGAGDVVVLSHWKFSGDTVLIQDYGGQYACLNETGKYKLGFTDNILSFTLIDDPCEGRAGSLSTSKWMKAPEK